MDDLSPAEAQAASHRYILVMLLQRLEGAHPGLLQGMLDGARADRAAVVDQGLSVQVFDEAVDLLDTIHTLDRMALIADSKDTSGR